jgi:drug/metabolite transporter (DMT)-like permease
MLKGINKHFLLLHLIVFIWGFSPILGRFILTDTYSLVWYRLLITVAVMYGYIRFTKVNLKIPLATVLKLSGIGIIILIHWLCFYGAIKVSNISVTMVSFSTGTLFSALIEPLFFKRKIRIYELVIGLVIILGIGFIFTIETKYWLGIILGMLASLTAAFFGVMNGLMIRRNEATVISFYELFAALTGLSIIMLFIGQINPTFFQLDMQSVIGLLVLALVCTVFPFIASVNLYKHISPYTQILTVNLETVYGILWAIIFYHENKEVKPGFYIGVLIILAAVFINPIIKKHLEKKKQF